MQITEFIPTEQLKPYIKAYKIIESRNGTTNRVLPGTSFAMSFLFKGQISYLKDTHKTPLPFATFSGLQKSARLINYDTNTSAIIVLFKETGISAFFKEPLHELFGQSIALDHYFQASEILILQDQLSNCKNHPERIAVLEQFLVSKLTDFSPDKLVSAAIAKINASNGNIRIRELVKEFYLSQDAFEKRFRKITGATPKQFSHIVKMNTAISQHTSAPSFLDIAFENGYYDQSHFNKYFKIFTGLTPSEFFNLSAFW